MKLKKRKTSSDQITIENLKDETPAFLIPSGSTMLNLACSDSIKGAYGAGKIANLIGDSSSGKTILAWSMLAEVCNDPSFKDYKLIYDDVEAALEINVKKMFGTKTSERVEKISSDTVEDFYGTVVSLTNDPTPFIYVLDSLDALTCVEEQKRAEEYAKEKSNKGGSFKTEKPRMIAEIMRVIVRKIKKSNSFVLIISQTRDNIGFSSMFVPKTRSGGKALKFYCTHEIWLAVGKKYKELEREIGADVQVKVTKNKLTGKKRSILFPLYYDYGVDSIGSCINFLLEEKHWKKSGSNIDATEFNLVSSYKKIIDHIENNSLEKELDSIVNKVWNEIEEKIKLNRKSRYE
jgi:recombination protein RecA